MFLWNTWKYCWSRTNDEILPVSSLHNFSGPDLKFIFSDSHEKLFLVLFLATCYILNY